MKIEIRIKGRSVKEISGKGQPGETMECVDGPPVSPTKQEFFFQ